MVLAAFMLFTLFGCADHSVTQSSEELSVYASTGTLEAYLDDGSVIYNKVDLWNTEFSLVRYYPGKDESVELCRMYYGKNVKVRSGLFLYGETIYFFMKDIAGGTENSILYGINLADNSVEKCFYNEGEFDYPYYIEYVYNGSLCTRVVKRDEHFAETGIACFDLNTHKSYSICEYSMDRTALTGKYIANSYSDGKTLSLIVYKYNNGELQRYFEQYDENGNLIKDIPFEEDFLKVSNLEDDRSYDLEVYGDYIYLYYYDMNDDDTVLYKYIFSIAGDEVTETYNGKNLEISFVRCSAGAEEPVFFIGYSSGDNDTDNVFILNPMSGEIDGMCIDTYEGAQIQNIYQNKDSLIILLSKEITDEDYPDYDPKNAMIIVPVEELKNISSLGDETTEFYVPYDVQQVKEGAPTFPIQNPLYKGE